MGRAPCCDEKLGLKKGPWTPDEDQKLVAYIQQHGHGSWRALPQNAGLSRCGKSCRLRWTNYLRPDIKRGRFSQEEDQMIVNLHALLGNRWSAIASHLPRRTDNEIKNYWNTHLKKRLMQVGIDPATHKPSFLDSKELSIRSPGLQPRWVSSNLDTHRSQWDCARAEADARLSTISNLNSKPGSDHPDDSSSSSANFMSAWKAQVAETLRPTFGTVELERKIPPPNHPIHFQNSLQDWDQSSAATQPFSSRYLVSSYQCPPSMDPQLPLISSAASQAVAPHHHYWIDAANQPTAELGSSMFPPAAVSAPRMDTDNQSSAAGSTFFWPARIEAENLLSPTSTLQGPDSDFSNSSSPCSGSSNSTCGSDCFQELQPQGSYHSFPLIRHHSHDPKPNNVFSAPEEAPTFWHGQQAAMVEALHPDCFLQDLGAAATQSFVVHEFGVPNGVEIPQFDSLCRGPEDESKFSFDSISVGQPLL